MNEIGAIVRPFMQILSRVAWILFSASVIAGALFLWLGPPATAREYHVKSEIERFVPTVGHGLIQLGGETFLLILVAYAARRWLRIRL
jgi:hypothetical protein